MDYLKKLNNNHIKTLSIDDLKFLNELISSGLPLNTALEIIKNNNNQKIIDNIKNSLNSGIFLEEAIKNYIPSSIKKYCIKLINIIGFNKGINISIHIYESHEKNKNYILSKSLYPLLLVIASSIALFIFDEFGLDSIIQMMSSFINDFTSISIFRLIFSIFSKFIVILVFVILGITIYLLAFNKEIYLYSLINKYLPNSIINIYFTREFIELYLILLENGYKTKESLDIISSLDKLKISAYISKEISKGLNVGNNLIESLKVNECDLALSKFMSVASYSTNYIGIIKRYLDYSNKRIEKCIKNITLYLQSASYVVIGFIIIFIYQLLFLPMQAIINY